MTAFGIGGNRSSLLREIAGEIIASHDRGADLSTFDKYRDDPAGFIRDVLGGAPWSKQAEIAEAVRDHARVAVQGCNASGKDWLSARLALWAIYARKALVIAVAPTERQSREVLMGEIRSAFHANPSLPGELYEGALRVDRDGRVGLLSLTAASPDVSRLTGHHAREVMAIVTEAQGCGANAFEALNACATGAGDRFLIVGNPLAPTGDFFKACNSPSWRRFKISAFDHPNIIESRTIIPGGPTQEWIDRMAADYGKESAIYVARALGEFPDLGEDSLYARDWLMAAMVPERFADLADAARGRPAMAAVDVARLGGDKTILAIRRGDAVLKIIELPPADLMQTCGRIGHELLRAGIKPGFTDTHQKKVGRVVIDSIGEGSGVADRLDELGYAVDRFIGGAKAKKPERFANRRAEAYWALRDALEAARVALPRDDLLVEELLATRWIPTSSGQVRVIPKDEIRVTLGRSPDRADALSMLWGLVYLGPPRLKPLHYSS